MVPVSTFSEFSKNETIRQQLRQLLRKCVIAANSAVVSDKKKNKISLPYYHHVFDDERKGFERQIKYMLNLGDFISIEEVIKILSGSVPLDGNYFCMSFDDGFLNCYTNMLPIVVKYDIPVIIYLPTGYIGLDIDNEKDRGTIMNFYPESPRLVPFLSWEQCREMMMCNISFGSHTVHHINLMHSIPELIEKELIESRQTIENRLGAACRHFACPWGRAGVDFEPQSASTIAKKTGYLSFASTNRGTMQPGDDPYFLKRDHLLANWENFQLKYFFRQ